MKRIIFLFIVLVLAGFAPASSVTAQVFYNSGRPGTTQGSTDTGGNPAGGPVVGSQVGSKANSRAGTTTGTKTVLEAESTAAQALRETRKAKPPRSPSIFGLTGDKPNLIFPYRRSDTEESRGKQTAPRKDEQTAPREFVIPIVQSPAQ
jgi:hypothetical protein